MQPADLLEDVEGNVGQGNTQTGKHGLHQETGGLLVFRNGIGNKGTERFHCRVVADVQEPQQQYGHPQGGNVRIDKETEAATDGANQEIRTAATQSGHPSAVTHRTNHRLHQQTGNRACHIQNRQLAWVGMKKAENRINRSLLQPEAILNTEETEVHQHNLAKCHRHLWGDFHRKATPG